MSITLNDRATPRYVATAGQTVFNYDFPIKAASELVVYRKRAGVPVVLTLATDYTVQNIGSPVGGTFTLTSGATAGDIYAAVGDTPLERTSDFLSTQALSPTLLNPEFDRFVKALQEQKARVERAMVVDPTATVIDLTLPSPEAGKLIGWNDALDGLENVSPTTVNAISDVPGLVAALAGKQASLGFTPENAANKGQTNGYAPLNSSGLVPSIYLPSYVDDVLEFANVAAFPGTGEAGKMYVALDTSRAYRWSGSLYLEISPSPGSTDAVPEGSVNKYFTDARALVAMQTALSGQLLALANIKVGTPILSLSPTPATGHIRLTEATQSVVKTSYPELDKVVSSWGYPWGSTGTTFNLPPAAGYFLRFAATSTSIDTSGARAAGSIQADQNQAHSHAAGTLATDSAGAHTHTIPDHGGAAQTGGGTTAGGHVSGSTIATSSAGAHTHTISGSTASSGGAEVRTKNVAMHVDVVATPAAINADVYGVNGVPYKFDPTTTAGDPGAGDLRLNAVSPGSATSLFISETGATSEPLSAWLDTWAVGGKGQVEIYQVGAVGTFLIADVTAVVDSGSYKTVSITPVSSNGTFSNGALLGVLFYRAGPVGPASTVAGPPGPAYFHESVSQVVASGNVTEGGWYAPESLRAAMTLKRIRARVLTGSGSFMLSIIKNSTVVYGPISIASGAPVTATVAIAFNANDALIAFVSDVSNVQAYSIQLDGDY